MLNLGAKILLPHLSFKELSVSELQNHLLLRDSMSVTAIALNSVFNSFGETKGLLCYSPSLDLCLSSTF